ncbi:MAG: DUF3834 domain-containing protein [Dictyoglomus sp.]|nr:DUF3834 domain-containing protein [Dictyoglomus sp.]MCX7941829.1 DUF3834 domain-containing protein [Dictyoglomaceae bacterium]MDW8188069.1 DUF3834 domain-containing protein [Dictyoglomus sp.]
MKKIILILLVILLISNPNLAFSNNLKKIEVLIPLGPSIIPFAPLILESSDFNFTIWRTIDELTIRARDSKYDVIIAPFITLVNLYNKGVNIKYLATFNFSAFYLISNKAKKFEELKGETLYIAQKGSTQDIIFNIFLQQTELKDKINIYYSTPQEITSLYISGKINNALLPEPFVSMCLAKNGRILLDIQQVYRWISKGKYLPITSIAIRRDLNKKDIERIDKLFRDNFKNLNMNPENYIEKSSKILNIEGHIIRSSLKRLAFRYQGYSIKRDLLNFLEYIYEKAPQLIGNIPDENFFKL